MRFTLKPAISLAVVVFFSVLLAGCAPDVPGPYTLERARQLEAAGTLDQSASLYHYIVRENQKSQPAIAANALYEAGLFLQDPKRFATTPDRKVTGEDQAETSWKQLRDDFPDQAKELLRLGKDDDKLKALALHIDQRNATNWDYKLIDSLVQATGKNPAFSYGLALIIIACLVKLILFPLTRKQYASQREMQRMQPYIKELQKKFKGQELSQKQMELYKEHGVNPFAGCVPMIFQLPFLIMVFTAIRHYEHAFVNGRFLWVGSSLAFANPTILGTNLATPDIPLLVLYVITNYVTMRLSPAPDPQQQQQQNSMALMTSAIFFYMFLNYKWSSAFVLYWLAQNLISIWQQYHFIYQPRKAEQLAGGGAALASGPKKLAATIESATKTPNGTPKPAAGTATPPRARPRKKK